MTVTHVDTFIADLKDSVSEAKMAPSGKGIMVSLYGMSQFYIFVSATTIADRCAGLGNSSAVGPSMVSELAVSFLDALYKA